MTTPNPKVAAWAESMGFKWHANLEIWYKPYDIKFGFVPNKHVIFTYCQMLRAKIEAANKIQGFLILGEDTDRVTKYVTELKAELQELEEEK